MNATSAASQGQPAPALRATKVVPVLTFTLTYLVAALALALARGNLEFLFYIGVMLTLMVVVWVVHRHVRLTTGVLWCLSIWGLAHMAGGLLTVPAGWPTHGGNRVLYSVWLIPGRLKYDHLVHAFGFGVTTWVCWQGLRGAFRRRGVVVYPAFGLLVLAVAGGLGFGALNEVVEFVATLLVPETNVGGYENTGWDLVANAIGAMVAAGLIWKFERDERVQVRSEAARSAP